MLGYAHKIEQYIQREKRFETPFSEYCSLDRGFVSPHVIQPSSSLCLLPHSTRSHPQAHTNSFANFELGDPQTMQASKDRKGEF